MLLTNKHITVVGLGRSGEAAARFLARKGSRVTVVDHGPESRFQAAVEALTPLGIQFRLGSQNADADAFETADAVVLSPGVPHTLPMLAPARKKGIPVIGEMELAAAHVQEPILAITGTNGKTTTTELAGKLLENSGIRVFVGGNIGTPLIAYADGVYPKADVLVVEVSSFQLDTIARFRPATAVMLNITPDHLDRYADFSAYAASKWKIFHNQEPCDLAVLNAMDQTVMEMLGKHQIFPRCRFFSTRAVTHGAWIDGDTLRIMEDGHETASFSLARSPLPGLHNQENIAAACLAVRAHGATDAGIQKILDTFTGLSHRMEPVGTCRGVRFVNDSKATNVDAVNRALDGVDGPVILIMGGQNKNCDFRQLREKVQARVKILVTMGEARDDIAAALAGAPGSGILAVHTLAEAVEKAFLAAHQGDTVLLSPGCASFDQFSGYAQRGDRFREVVKTLT